MAKLIFAIVLVTLLSLAYGFSQNAIDLGLVSEKYPLVFWDALANLKESDLSPQWRRIILFLDRKRAGTEHWCCHHGRDEVAKVPVYNEKGEVVAWNEAKCEKVGCCRKYLEVANHCLDKGGQGGLLDALDHASERLGDADTQALIDLIAAGGSIGY